MYKHTANLCTHIIYLILKTSLCCCSVTQWCSTLYDPMGSGCQTSLVAQLAKNPPAMQVQLLGGEVILEKEHHSSILGRPWWLTW